MRVGVLASGGGTNLQALIDGAESDYEIILVASDRKDAHALQRARAAGITAEVIADPQDGPAIVSLLDTHRLDLIVLAGYLRLVPPDVVERFANKIINVHPALLPSFGGKGMYGSRVHEAVIEAGVALSGVTVHLVDEEFDGGQILAQWPVPVLPDDCAEVLQKRVLAVEHEILPEVVRQAARHGRPVVLRQFRKAFAPADDTFFDFEKC